MTPVCVSLSQGAAACRVQGWAAVGIGLWIDLCHEAVETTCMCVKHLKDISKQRWKKKEASYKPGAHFVHLLWNLQMLGAVLFPFLFLIFNPNLI